MVLGDPPQRVVETYQGVVTHRLRTPVIQSHPDYRNQAHKGIYQTMDMFFILNCSFILKHIYYNLIKLCILIVCSLLDLIKMKKVFLHLFEISCHSVSMEAQGQFASVYSFLLFWESLRMKLRCSGLALSTLTC